MEIINPTYTVDPVTGQTDGIKATVDGIDCLIPLCPGNRHYDYIIVNGVTVAASPTIGGSQ